MSCSGGAERAAWRLAALALALSICAWSDAARAEQTEDERSAEALFVAGRALLEQGRIDDACPMFARSVEIGASVGALVNLARCHELQGKTATAWREYREAAAMASAEQDEERAAAARSYAERLEPKLSRLSVDASRGPADLSIALDGEPLPRERWSDTPVDPGSHRIEARGAGYAWSTSIEVDAGGDRTVVAVPPANRREPPATEPDPDWRRPLGIGMASLGAASIVAGAVLGILVLQDASEAESDPALCPDKLCSAEGEAFIERSRDKALAASLALGLGAAVLVGGGVVFFTAPAAGAEARLAPMVSPTAAGVVVGGRF